MCITHTIDELTLYDDTKQKTHLYTYKKEPFQHARKLTPIQKQKE